MLMLILGAVGGAIALFWPTAKPTPLQPFALGVHPLVKQTQEVEALAALNKVKAFVLSRGVPEDEVNAAISPLLIHFTHRGD